MQAVFVSRILLFVGLLLLSTVALCLPDGEQFDRFAAEIAQSGLPEAEKETLTKRLESLRKTREEVLKLQDAARSFKHDLETLPDINAALRRTIRQVERQSVSFSEASLSGLALDDLEKRRVQAEGRVQALEDTVAEQLTQVSSLRESEDALRDKLEAANRAELASAKASLEEGSGDLVAQLGRWQRELSAAETKARIDALEAELQSLPVREDHLRLMSRQNDLTLQQSIAELKAIDRRLREVRVAEASGFRQQAQRLADETGANPDSLVREWADQNIQLSQELEKLAAELSELQEVNSQISKSQIALHDRFVTTRQKVEVAGLSQALGLVLLEERRALASLPYLGRNPLVDPERVSDFALNQIEREDRRRRFLDQMERLESGQNGSTGEPSTPDIDLLSQLGEGRLALYDDLIRSGQRYLREVAELDYALKQYKRQATEYRTFINERLLWIRSAPAVSFDLLVSVPQQVTQLFDRQLFQQAASDIGNHLSLRPIVSVLIAGLFFWWLKSRRGFLSALQAAAEPLKRLRTDNYMATLRALLITLVLSLPLPLLVLSLGLYLHRVVGLGPLLQAVAPALVGSGLLLLFIRFMRCSLYPNGLMRAHFKWSASTIDAINLGLSRLTRWFLPSWFLALWLVNFDFGSTRGALPHLALAVTQALLALSLLPVVQRFMVIAPQHLWSLKVLRLFIVFSVLTLGVGGLSGYLYTASTLTLQFLETCIGLSLLLVLYFLVLRWLALTQRQMAYRQALERRAAQRQKANEKPEETGSESLEVSEEPIIDLEAVSRGARELLRTLLFLVGVVMFLVIWADILPALGVLEDFRLWNNSAIIDGTAVDSPITLLDVVSAILIVVITILATKRLPALLEFILAHRAGMTASGLYTVKTLSGYVIVAVGILATFNSLGANWSQIQWLAAALSVGIGFGLQEIVANFISGLIILFERPIRVGDVVTVGDTDGVVTRINIRATTIRNWDQKELLVPNKEFITGRLLNWTLSDQTTRLFIPVGVAYGSDVEKAMKIILEAATLHPNIMKDPAPSVFFESLGDNALILNLRSYVKALDHRLPTISELHTTIYHGLNEAGIVIAYPQRDVHLDTLKPLEVRVVKEVNGSAS